MPSNIDFNKLSLRDGVCSLKGDEEFNLGDVIKMRFDELLNLSAICSLYCTEAPKDQWLC